MNRALVGPIPRQTNGKAIAALLCGVLSLITCLLFVGIAAVALANVAIDEIALSQGTQDGRAMAVVGRILGWVATALLIIVLIVFLVLLTAIATR